MPTTRAIIEGRIWVLDRADSSLESGDDMPVTLLVSGEGASGDAPCNLYRGGFALDGDTVRVTGIAQTLMGCETSIMEAEVEYLDALGAVDTVEASVDRLVLGNSSGVRLAFVGYQDRDLLVGTWSVVDVSTDDAIVSVLPGRSRP